MNVRNTEIFMCKLGAFRRDSVQSDLEVQVHVLAFEGDLTSSPRARVRVVVRVLGAPPQLLTAEAPATGDGPVALAAAMAVALEQVTEQVRELLSR